MPKWIDVGLLSTIAAVLSGLGAMLTAGLTVRTIRLEAKMRELMETKVLTKGGYRASGANTEETSSDKSSDGASQ